MHYRPSLCTGYMHNQPSLCTGRINYHHNLCTGRMHYHSSLCTGRMHYHTSLCIGRMHYHTSLCAGLMHYLIKPLSETHTRNLRSVTDGSLKVPRSKTTLYDSSFSAAAPKLWNTLPGEIKTSTTLDSFKKAAKHHFMLCS